MDVQKRRKGFGQFQSVDVKSNGDIRRKYRIQRFGSKYKRKSRQAYAR